MKEGRRILDLEVAMLSFYFCCYFFIAFCNIKRQMGLREKEKKLMILYGQRLCWEREGIEL